MTKEQKRMRVNGAVIVVTGIAFATMILSPLYPAAQLFLNLAHWPFFEAPAVLDPTQRLMLAISGGLTVGIGVMMWVVGTEVMPKAPAEGRHVVLYSAISWFAVDSTFSIIAGSPTNAALNLIFLALMLCALDFKMQATVA